MNMIVRFLLERIFIVVFGLVIILIGIVSPRYALLNLCTTFQRVKIENNFKEF